MQVIAWLWGKLFPPKIERKNEVIAHQWDTLKALWKGCRASVTDAAEQGEIDKLFPNDGSGWLSGAEAWRQLNSAEQRVGAHLDAATVGVEYEALLDIAKGRSSPLFATYEAKKGLFADPPAPAGTTLQKQRAAYISFLQALQGEFIETRFRRQLRRETAIRLFGFGALALFIALAPFLVLWICGAALQREPGFAVAIVACLGVLGAYFSRVMSFHSKLASINFDDVMNLYQGRMLALRLLYGTIGAIVFYFILRAGVLGSGAFPDITKLPTIPPIGESFLAPGPDLAKLLIWSFLAGFSERLVPDALDRTEAQANKTP